MKKLISNIVIVGAIIMCIGNAFAKDFEQRLSIDAKSRSVGLGEKTIELLERVPGPGPSIVADRIATLFANSKSAISTSGEFDIDFDHNNVKIMGEDWLVKAWGTGNKFMYFNDEYTRRKGYQTIPVEKRFSNETLESMGRKFIDENLQDLVKLGIEEELVPLKTEFELVGSVNEFNEETEEKVMSSVVVFGRKVDGFDIVGPGSTIAIFFANDGVPFGFDVDWPEYKRSELTQDTIPVNEIFERLSTYGLMNSEADNVVLHKLDCGYFDAGESSYDPYSYIQAGCVAQTIGTKTDEYGLVTKTPVLNHIPAGVDVVWDDKWRDSQLVGVHGDQCMETNLSQCIPETMQAEQGTIEKEIIDNLAGPVSTTN